MTREEIEKVLFNQIVVLTGPQHPRGYDLKGIDRAAAEIAVKVAASAPKPSTIQDAIDALAAEALVTKTHGNLINGLIVQLRGLLDKRDRALDMAIRAGTGSPGPRGVVDAAKAFEAYLSGQ